MSTPAPTPRLEIFFIYGFGASDQSTTSGFATLRDEIKTEFGQLVEIEMREWTEEQVPTLFAPCDAIAIIGHSFGGDEAIEFAERLGQVPVAFLALLDPVPQNWFKRWFCKNIFKIPANVHRAICWWVPDGTKGKIFKSQPIALGSDCFEFFNNARPDLGHTDFPKDNAIRKVIKDEIRRVVKSLTSEVVA